MIERMTKSLDNRVLQAIRDRVGFAPFSPKAATPEKHIESVHASVHEIVQLLSDLGFTHTAEDLRQREWTMRCAVNDALHPELVPSE
jgi:hypothetical protein